MDTAEEIKALELSKQKYDKSKKMVNVLTEHEWKVIEEIIDILHPAYEFMKKMQKQSHTLSDFYVTWELIKHSLISYENNHDNLLTDLTKTMQAKMLAYEPRLFMNPLLLCALYLDPRVACTLNQLEDQAQQRKALAKSEIFKVFKRLKKENITPTLTSTDKPRNSNRLHDLADEYDDILDSMMLASNPSSNNQNSINTSFADEMLQLETECIQFESEKRIKLKSNILHFWEHKKKQYPILYQVSQVIMAVPSSQTSIERCFSSFSFIYSNLRTSLGSNILQAILLIRTNPELFDEVCNDLMVAAE